MSQDRSVFSFELNEVLSFERGQEVAEMKGISLEPDISIQPFNDYISIRGVIELKGEYQKTASRKEDTIELEDYQAKRFVEKVEEYADGMVEFTHRFPVEISVPTYRVQNLNDVSVYIDSFDYEIPDDSSLKLYSTIEIYGISEVKETPQVEREQPSFEDEWRLKDELKEQEEQLSDTFDTTAYEKEETLEREVLESQKDDKPEESLLEREALDFEFEVKAKEEPKEELNNTPFSPPEIPEINQTADTDSESALENEEDDRWKYKETKSFSEFFNKPAPEEKSASEADLEAQDVDVEETELQMEVAETNLDEAIVNHDINESPESREDAVQDVSYLSGMFRSSEEEQFTKMRLCIVQEKDTIESIAERYQVTTLQLIKQNSLDEDYEVSEGQLLYIPKKR